MGAHRSGQSVAQRTMRPVGDKVAPGGGPAVMSRKIGAGRARVGNNDRVLRQQVLQCGDHPLRPDRRFAAVCQRLKCSQFVRPCGGLRVPRHRNRADRCAAEGP